MGTSHIIVLLGRWRSRYVLKVSCHKIWNFLGIECQRHRNNQSSGRKLPDRVSLIYYLVPPCSIKSTPPLTTPTNPPVCITSLPPPLNLYSTSASPESHATLVCGGTSSFASSSPSAVSMSANARPLFALSMLTVFRQEVTSEFSMRVSRMTCMSEG